MKRRLDLPTQSEKLAAVVARVREIGAGRAPLVVFDLDGTLMDNRPRTCAIMADLAEKWRVSHPREAALLKTMVPERLDYLLDENLRAIGIEDEALLAGGFEHWKAHFFFDSWIHHDTPLPGAVEFAHACRDAGAIIVYFTGRDLPNMALGTFASLRDAGFPIGVPGTELVLKPSPEMDDTEFKRAFTPLVAQRERAVALVRIVDGERTRRAELEALEAQRVDLLDGVDLFVRHLRALGRGAADVGRATGRDLGDHVAAAGGRGLSGRRRGGGLLALRRLSRLVRLLRGGRLLALVGRAGRRLTGLVERERHLRGGPGRGQQQDRRERDDQREPPPGRGSVRSGRDHRVSFHGKGADGTKGEEAGSAAVTLQNRGRTRPQQREHGHYNMVV